ncbi:ATP-binding protein [Deinococcus xinjiangensis]|uniref:ATP-binding protein n=1 Tax=Deinococcus xinjiangensis TaxID=457454 RepID=UPI00336575C7
MSILSNRVEYESLNDLLEDRGLIDDEGTRVEIKSGKGGLPNGFWTSVNAFSNTVGGYILLGFHDVTKEVIKDVEIDRLQKDISSGIALKLEPPVAPTLEVLRVAGQKIIMVSVTPADTHLKPIYLVEKGKKGWKRVGSSNLQLSKEDIERMLLEKAGKSPDSYVVGGFGLRHLDTGTLARYRQRLQNLRPTHRLLSKTDEQLLQSLNCLTYTPEKDLWELNRAGLLIFGQEQYVRSVFPSLEVQILRFDEPNWELTAQNRGRKSVLEGRALFDFVPDLEETLLQLFPPTVKVTSGKIGRDPDPIYDALREAIVNAIAHQDFLAARYIQIRIFSDRLEIENPGYSKKPVELFSEPGSLPRNPLIAYAFEIVEYVEKQGFGGSIMIDSIEKAGFTPPKFNSSVDKNSFTVTFFWQHFMSQEDLTWVAEFGEMPEDDKKALVYAKNNNAMKNSDVRRLCGHDTLKASKVLQRLKARQLLELHGTGKQAYYTLTVPSTPTLPDFSTRQLHFFDVAEGVKDRLAV